MFNRGLEGPSSSSISNRTPGRPHRGRADADARPVAVLLAGSAEALEGFSEAKRRNLKRLLKRLIVNLDRIAAV